MRCSWCFGKFMHNHTPVKVNDYGNERLMHKSCAKAFEAQRNPIWPARVVKPPKDE